MDILVPDSWLRDFLKTGASIKDTAEKLSLCGPSVEAIETKDNDSIYKIEVTTNRVDSASVYGIAREAYAILPRFGLKTRFKEMKVMMKQRFFPKVSYLDAKVDKNLCPRFTAVLIKNVHITKSPPWIVQRLEKVGVRAINNCVDISNYVMHEIGQPVHTFDYDKIQGAKMILRESKRGEKITTLDSQTYTLPGGDIVIEDKSGYLIDLAGIMGGANSAVDENTKNVLLFVQTYNPTIIRKTSMALPKRTEAVILFEKGLDTELVTLGIKRGIELFEQITKGKSEDIILDIYPNPPKPKKVSINYDSLCRKIGITIDKNEVLRLLHALGFECKWVKDKLDALPPSYRLTDITIAEDIVEEVARIYGYFKLPSELMQGQLPPMLPSSPFSFEIKIKNLLKSWGGIEIYTYSMVSKEWTQGNALKLKNPLGRDSEYMRTGLMSSLLASVKQNSGEKDAFHLFEMANIYLPRKYELPEEKMTLGGVFSDYEYRSAKGIIEALLDELKIEYLFEQIDLPEFLPSRSLLIKSNGKTIGKFGITSGSELIYYEFGVMELLNSHKSTSTYTPLSKYPPQIEDITLALPDKTRVGDVISSIKSVDRIISSVILIDIYKDSYTLRIQYLHPQKTLNDSEVGKIRDTLLKKVKDKFGAQQK